MLLVVYAFCTFATYAFFTEELSATIRVPLPGLGVSYAVVGLAKAVRDSMMYDCFGVAQDLQLKFRDWGFQLPDIRQNVFMRHSKADDAVPFQTAIRTAELLFRCQLQLTETDPHFSAEVLYGFMCGTIVKHLSL